jgi:hypothetical protein
VAGAVIAERQKTVEAEQQHKALLARLTGLAEQEDGDDAAAINSVRQQLQALKVTGRQNVNLDPDEVRVTENGNPTLEGEYTLWLPAKPTTVTVMGLISSPGKKPFTPGRDVASYLDEQSLLSGADNSYAWVVYPDGHTQKAPSLTGINAISNPCRAASFLSVLPTISGRRRMTGLTPISFTP